MGHRVSAEFPPARLTDAEREAHAAFLGEFKCEPIWRDYLGSS